MSTSHDEETARGRIHRVFRFLQEMHRVRTPPIVQLAQRDWALGLDGLPQSSHLQRGYRMTTEHRVDPNSDPTASGFILKVGRPQETECPEPSVVIRNWLKPGWDEVGADREEIVRNRLRGGRQSFADAEERVEAFEEWWERRRAWEQGERHVVEALGVFGDLFDLHAKFERESEKYQLFLADGILVLDDPEQPGGRVHHPLLLQRVDLRFHAGIPEFTVVDSESNPEVYTPLLRHVGLDGRAIQAVVESVEREHFHPLAGSSTSAFLRDFVQRNWTHGQFFEDERDVAGASGPLVYRQPQLLLGDRNQGLGEAIERYLEALPACDPLPESLLRIVGIEPPVRPAAVEAAEGGAPPDLLMTKPANAEQEQVLRRLDETGAVLVQGPPGTGKSHTIANLIGHLLAQNKSILVTSHASKALRVVREKLAEPLQPLCVSVLQSDEESTRQLEESITGILNYLSTTSEKKLERQIAKLDERRQALRAKRDKLRAELLEAVKAEYESLELDGELLPPSEAARKLVDEKGLHEWLPGPIPETGDLPLAQEEIAELYELGARITAEQEALLAASLPPLVAFPSPKQFASLFDELKGLEKLRLDTGAEFWRHDEQDPDALPEFLQALKDGIDVLRDQREWALACIEAGRGGGRQREAWTELVELVDACGQQIPEWEPLVVQHGPQLETTRVVADSIATCRSLLEHVEAGKPLGRFALWRHRDWARFLEEARVESGAPSEPDHFRAILGDLQIRQLRERLAQRWDRQMAPLGAPAADELGPRPEVKALPYADEVRRALEWEREVWKPLEAAIEELGLDWERLARKRLGRKAARSELDATRELVESHLPELIEERQRWVQRHGLATRREEWLAHLREFSRKDAIFPVIKRFRTAILKGHYDAYAEAYHELGELAGLRESHERRGALLERLEAGAEPWARALRERSAPHDAAAPPGDAISAWRYRQCEQRLTRLGKIDLDRHQERLDAAHAELLGVTADYVEKKAWIAQLRRTDLESQQALAGWLGLHKKIGKGGGRHVARLKEEARRTLVQCRNAVPVWIMPLSRVVENFDLATTRFDVVIVDEASQSDVLGLTAFALGREVVVVGDHEQVSPYAVGQSTDRILALIDEFLTDIPNRELYDGKTSVYDLARQSFGGTIRLLEHFRCVPDIIQFSNQLCYGGEVQPLREAASARVGPALVAHRVRGGVESNGVNKNEALEIASLVSAICKLEEYEDCTIGVICMVGTDQALYIDSVLRKRLTVSEYQRRQILCGNASQFQGDERDVIFLSIVNSPGENGPLHLRQREDARKVFNVAASRARDQLWVVHSLDPGADLKGGDLRLRLISHAEKPEASRPKRSKERKAFRSELEKQVYLELHGAGIRLVQQYPVGECVIDLVAEGEGGRRVAIQCDGDRVQTGEAVEEEMDRQRALRRLGWEFVRVRGSQFFRNRDRTLKQLTRRLEELEIRPAPPAPEGETPAEAPRAEPLLAKVVKRAELIRSRWRDIPTVSSIRAAKPEPPQAAAEAPEADEAAEPREPGDGTA